MNISRVFVANRGEIALRIVRACQKLGLESVLGASEVDLEGPAARLADRVVCIGPAPAERSYLRHDTVVHAALGTGCDAIHPGYGFLAENPELAAGALEHGLRFVGPPPEVMALAGDKLRARAAAAKAGLPVVPGREVAVPADAHGFAEEWGYPVLLKAASGGGGRGIKLAGDAAAEAGLPVVPGREVAAAADAHGFAEEWGYPVLLKAASGGGGRGIKLAGDAAELEALHSTAAAEARAAFGDERLYVERRVGDARHVEVQVAADDHGAVIHMGERDCSVQRRHQKLIEEAPAPFLTDPTREAVREAGVTFARAIGYRNLGTVEFLVDTGSDEFFFLEMNCRIQVEHPVTEAVTGYDLVAKQLEIAAGDPLGMAQPDVAIAGHAVECRLTAENVSEGFRPSPGTLTRFEVPDVANLRVDTHCEEGTVIPPHYDSLMAKLIGFGAQRDAAVDVVREALDGLRVEGVETNRELLASVLAHDDFARGAVTTCWLEEAVAA